MEDRPSQSKNVANTTRRGGAAGSPLHILQMLIATVVLLASSWFLIRHDWLIGFILLAIGTPLCFINLRYR